jgi:hypothetical protein
MQHLLLGLSLLLVASTAATGCGAAYKNRSATAVASGSVGGGVTAASATELAEQLVIEGALLLEVSQIEGLVSSVRAQVEQLGGRIVKEDVSGLGESWRAQLTLRVPPQHVEPLVTYLAGRGELLDKSISSADVSKTLFDQELAIKNAQLTLDRLEGILRQGGLSMQDVLAIEREMTRLRGEIESIKGQAQFLKDKVALATLEVTITRKSGAVRIASAKAYPGARVSTLLLLSPDGRPQSRLGAGFVLHTIFRAMTLEIDLYQREHGPEAAATDDKSMAVLATYGGAFYSDFLGHGERSFLNPYLGFRLGYGYLDSHRFVAQAEAGVELWKTPRFSIDVNARATGLIGSRSDAAAVLGASAALAF